MRDRRYRYTIEVIDFVGNHVPTADFMVAAQRDGTWLISGEGFDFAETDTVVAQTVEVALARIAERVADLIDKEEPF